MKSVLNCLRIPVIRLDTMNCEPKEERRRQLSSAGSLNSKGVILTTCSFHQNVFLTENILGKTGKDAIINQTSTLISKVKINLHTSLKKKVKFPEFTR